MPKIQITLSEDQLALVEHFRGSLGNTQSEIIRNIVLAWLSEKSFVSTYVKENKMGKGLNDKWK